MIHMTKQAVRPVAEIIPRVEADVVYVPPRPKVLRNPRTYTRKTLFEGNGRRLLWEGLGTDVSSAGSANEVCKLAGLHYQVETEDIFTGDGLKIPNKKATRRYDIADDGVMIPSTVFGIVSDQYKVIQNWKGFEFIDTLFNHDGFLVETAGQFDNGKIVWIEAKLPDRLIAEENIAPYLVFTNRHDGAGSVRIFLTSVRVICKNTLNYAIRSAQGRSFNVRHTASGEDRLKAARQTIENYNNYLTALGGAIEHQKRVLLTDNKLDQMIDTLLQFKETDTDRVKERVKMNREELRRYYNASDLDGYGNTGFRFINAVSDWATHRVPSRQTANYASNLFQSTLNGNEFIDVAYNMVDEMDEVISIAMS